MHPIDADQQHMPASEMAGVIIGKCWVQGTRRESGQGEARSN
jgi:hypothetical protein